MAKNLIIPVLAVVLVITVPSGAAGGDLRGARLLREGFTLAGVDGKLREQENKWFFEFGSDVSDDGGFVKAGTVIELLPSAALEKILDVKKRSEASPVRSKSAGADVAASVQTPNGASYRLWGRVTRYEGKNFIFGIYFLPVSEAKQPQSAASEESQQRKPELIINEPNDALVIPEEIIAKLATRRVIRSERLIRGLELKQDFILAERIGFIRDSGHEAGFVLDAVGRGVQQISFRLLPCQMLEVAQQRQSAEPDPIRFKISGIVTQYEGKHYLLLQRATRVYSYGNFGR